MYRAITRLAGEAGVSPSNEQALAALAGSTEFELHGGALAVNGRPVSDDLFGPDVDASVSAVSAHPAVRTSLVAWQRRLARGRCIVMVGRDIGTVVLPNARVKLWLTASPEERARRREAQRSGQAGGQTLARLEARDRVDAGRFTSPARPAPDAVVIDTDGLDPEAVVQLALEAVGSALEGPS
jgi:cytidylate kinase